MFNLPSKTVLSLAIVALSVVSCVDDTQPPSDGSSGSDSGSETSAGSVTVSVSSTGLDTTAAPDDTASSSTTEPANSTSSDSEDSTTGTPPMGGYGDCANFDDACLPEEACLFDGIRGVCSALGCETPTDCPISTLDGPVPPSGAPAEVVCMDASGDGFGDCFFECSVGLTAGCPEGMACVGLGNAAICMWPTFPPGGGQCPDVDLGSTAPQTFMGDSTGLGDDHFPLCSFASGEDVVLAWGPAPADGVYTFDTIGSSALPGGFDTTLAVLDACPGPDAIEIGCGNDQAGTDSGVQIALVEGQIVYLVVDSQFGDVGPFVLNVQ